MNNKNDNKNLKTKSSKNTIIYNNTNNNTKNMHKIINRKKGIILSTKSLEVIYTNNIAKNNIIENVKNNNKTIKENIINNEEININEIKYKIKKNKEININNNIKESEKENSDINKTYSESDLGEVGGEIIDDEESENENGLDEIDELNENDKIYYYEPKSIVNYSSVNFTNKKDNRKYQSLSVSKENKLSNNMFNKTLNTIVNKNLFNITDLNKSQNINLTSQISKNKNKNNEMKNLNDKINMKKNNIERINRVIENIQKEIKKYDNEIRVIDTWIQKEEKEGEKLRNMINFVNMK